MDWTKLKTGDDPAWIDAGKVLLPPAKRAAKGQCPGLSDDEAQSAAVEAFHEMIAEIDTIASLDDLKARLFERAGFRAIDITRKKHKKFDALAQADSIDMEEGPVYNPVDENTESPRKALDRAELRSIAADALEELVPPDGDVLRDVYLFKLTHRELGEKYGWETSSVGNRLNQILKRAWKCLSSHDRLLEICSSYSND